MTEILGGLLMMVGGGMLSVPLVELIRAERRPLSARVLELLRDTPPAGDTPDDMLRLLDAIP